MQDRINAQKLFRYEKIKNVKDIYIMIKLINIYYAKG